MEICDIHDEDEPCEVCLDCVRGERDRLRERVAELRLYAVHDGETLILHEDRADGCARLRDPLAACDCGHDRALAESGRDGGREPGREGGGE